MNEDAAIETRAVHAGRQIDPTTGAIATPIHLSNTFERDADGSYARGFSYARIGNPTRAALEECVASLEGGAAALAFSSGSAAALSIFQVLAPGDHVLFPKEMFYAIILMLKDILVPWGLELSFVEMDSVENVKAALRPETKVVWVETPSNPMLKISDIQAIADIAHEAGALCVVDGTFTTPILQRPLELGADFVVHSMSKFLGGHSDVVGGVVVAKVDDELTQKVRRVQQAGGAVSSPFDSWLVMRGIATLPYRMRAQTESACKIATFLDQHPAVEEVLYPGLPNHPGHELAKKQMSDFGPMLSFRVKRGERAAVTVAAWVELFIRATSLGGVESLIEHRASLEGSVTDTPVDLLRLAIGLENCDDLIRDLDQALTRVRHAPIAMFMDIPKRKR